MDHVWADTWRLTFEFATAGHFDKSPEAIIKGTLGTTLLDLHCPYSLTAREEPPCPTCPHRHRCPYPLVFKPAAALRPVPDATEPGPRTPPPPFTLRYLGPTQPQIGSRAHLDLTLVGDAREHIGRLTDALRRSAARGLGARDARARAELIDTLLRPPPQPITTTDRIRLRLETPLIIREWGGQGRDVLRRFDPISFGRALVRRLRDLADTYGHCGIPLPDPDSALDLYRSEVRVDVRRAFSARQDQTLYAEGLVGEVELGGPALATWLPALALGERLGVGRFTTWGNGRYAVWAMEAGER